jgi:hypothetical protein
MVCISMTAFFEIHNLVEADYIARPILLVKIRPEMLDQHVGTNILNTV